MCGYTQVNPMLNAVTDERFDAALDEAKEIDKNIVAGLPDDYFKNKPFLGKYNMPFISCHDIKQIYEKGEILISTVSCFGMFISRLLSQL